MNVLFIGDIFGKPGRQILQNKLAGLKREYKIDATIANGENVAGGFGITPELADELFIMGIDVITSGNHIWNKHEIKEYMNSNRKLLRPLNMHRQLPGAGSYILDGVGKKPLAVVNLIGRIFINNYDCPFRTAQDCLAEIKPRTSLIVVDFHAEATSEKRAMGWYLDGSVSAVIGTHTHVQTADEEILPGGTGYISDVGMTGPHDSVIGIEKSEIIEKMITQMPKRFNAAQYGVQINAVVLTLDETSGRCTKIERLKVKENG